MQAGRQVMRMDHLAVAHEGGPLKDVFELPYVAWPVVAGQHVDGRGRDPLDTATVLA